MPGSYDYDSLKEIQYLMNQKIISYTYSTLCNISEYHITIDKFLDKNIPHSDYVGGSIAHMSLKFLGTEFLKNQHIAYNIEVPFVSRIPDIITLDESIIIECGNTDPKKIFDYFNYNQDILLHIISYPFEDNTNIFMHTFAVQDKQEYVRSIHNKNQVESNDLKKLIQKRRNNME